MANRILANTQWEVAGDGLASSGAVEYFIPKNRLRELRHRRGVEGIASRHPRVAEKSGAGNMFSAEWGSYRWHKI